MQDTQARQLLVAEARRLALIHQAIDRDLTTDPADVDSRPVSDVRGPDAAAVTLEHEVEESLRHAVDDERAEVAFAHTRLDQRTFGTCVACGTTIPDERLELVPATRFCVPCEAVGESRHDQGVLPVFDSVVRAALREMDGWVDDELTDDDVCVPSAEEDAMHTRLADRRRQ